jgi:hypothetical protein
MVTKFLVICTLSAHAMHGADSAERNVLREYTERRLAEAKALGREIAAEIRATKCKRPLGSDMKPVDEDLGAILSSAGKATRAS